MFTAGLNKLIIILGLFFCFNNYVNEPKVIQNKEKKEEGRKSKNYFNKARKTTLSKIKKGIKEQTYEELMHNRKVFFQLEDYETEVRYVERMIALCKNENEIKNLKFDEAELYFLLRNYEKAAESYKKYVISYPGSDNTEQALYRSIYSLFQLTLPSTKDQTKTKDALNASAEYLSNKTYKKYRSEIESIVSKCNKKLLDTEVNIFYYNLTKKNYNGAQKRIDYIKDKFGKIADKNDLVLLEEHLKAAKENRKYVPINEQENSKIAWLLPNKNRKSNVDRF